MIKGRTWFSLCIMGVVTLIATASCGGNDEGTGGGAAGGGVLGGDGSSGAIGRGGAGNAGASLFGATCTTDAQCSAGLICLTSNAVEGTGPSNGVCTVACTSHSDCIALEAGSGCVDLSPSDTQHGYCMNGCTLGNNDASKCNGRPDFLCADLSAVAQPLCVPWCRADIECGQGMFCDHGTGSCVGSKPKGDPDGTACVPAITNASTGVVVTPGSDNCEGFCLRTSDTGVTPPTGVCAETCGAFLDCGYGRGSKPTGLCLGGGTTTTGVLELGYCLAACDCTANCPLPGDVCRAWASDEQAYATDLNTRGLCLSDASDTSEVTVCNDGAGGAGGASSVDGAAGDGGSQAGAGGASGRGDSGEAGESGASGAR